MPESPPAATLHILSPDGTQSLGVIADAVSVTYELAINRQGAWQADIVATPDTVALAVVGRRVQIRVAGEGVCFRGFIEQLSYSEDTEGRRILRVAGGSLARLLNWRSTIVGRQFSSATLSSVVSTLLAGTGWVAGTIAAPTTTFTGRFDGATIWHALDQVAQSFGLMIREDHLADPPRVDIADFTASPLVLANVPEAGQGMGVVPVVSVAVERDALSIVNRVIPLGQMTGVQGATPWLTLQNSTRTAPYTVQTATGPDGRPYHYIEDASSIAAYGVREAVIQFRDVTPLGVTSSDIINAANRLYDEAVSYLQARTVPARTYAVGVAAMRHLDDAGDPVWRVGQPVRLIYRGAVVTATGATSIEAIDDAGLYLAFARRTITAAGASNWQVILSSVKRSLPNDGNMAERFLEEIEAVRTTPLPFVVFGDNSMRISSAGYELVVPPDSGLLSSRERKIYWLRNTNFTGDVAQLFGYYNSGLNTYGFSRYVNVGTDSIIADAIYNFSTQQRYLASTLWWGGGFFAWAIHGAGWHPTKSVEVDFLGLQIQSQDDAALYIRKGGTMVEVGGGMSLIDVQTFTSSGTWVKPSGAKLVVAYVLGAGGGGGAGTGSGSSGVYGGGGGGGGELRIYQIPAQILTGTVPVVVGAGGAGGQSNGASGTAGGSSYFGDFPARGGGGGGGGVVGGFSGAVGGAGAGVGTDAGSPYAGGAPVAVYGGGDGGGSAVAGYGSIFGGAGGGGGGNANSGSASPGMSGGRAPIVNDSGDGGAGGSNSAGSAGQTGGIFKLRGGGGGGGGVRNSTPAYAGGQGGVGCGGGGGGGCFNSLNPTGGVGGSGGRGEVVVLSYG